MDLAFTTEQEALRVRVRALLERVCTPEQVRASWNTTTGRSHERWKALASAGVTGLTLPEEFGGMGLDETWLVLVLEEAGRAALPEALGAVLVAAGLLADAGSDAQREEWLPQIAAGDAIVVSSLPAPPWVDDAHVADLILLTEGIQVHAVVPAAVELVTQPALDPSRRRFLVRATLNARSCMAVWADRALACAADRATLAEAALLVGTAGRLVDVTRQHAREPKHAHARPGSVREVGHQPASAAAQTDEARAAVYGAARAVALDVDNRSDQVDTAHVSAAQAAHLAASAALQFHGALRDTQEHDLHPWLRRALMAPPVTGG